jgi:hypothetical protein
VQPSRLKVGVDVPWVTSWSAEEVLGIAPCITVDGLPAVQQRERPGYGRPQYSLNHHVRQRASIRGMLCPMCGAPTPDGDRWSLTGKLTAAGALRAKGLGFTIPPALPDEQLVLNAGAISPGHRTCMERSLQHCPHLQSDPTLAFNAFPEKWFVSLLTLEVAPDPPAANVLARPAARAPLNVVGFLQLCGITGRTDARWKSRRLRSRS